MTIYKKNICDEYLWNTDGTRVMAHYLKIVHSGKNKIPCLINCYSTAVKYSIVKVKIVPTAGGKLVQTAKDGQQDTMHNTKHYTCLST